MNIIIQRFLGVIAASIVSLLFIYIGKDLVFVTEGLGDYFGFCMCIVGACVAFIALQ